jgi:hypothetical protein
LERPLHVTGWFLPLQDEQAIEVALFLTFAVRSGAFNRDIHAWLHEMGLRLDIAVRSNGRYPCRFTDFQDLIEHPKDRSDEYRKDALAGSILIPLLAAWLAAFKDRSLLDKLAALKAGDLQDCTLQLWLPEKESEDHLRPLYAATAHARFCSAQALPERRLLRRPR